MAEGLARDLAPDVIEAYSAGTNPVGINPKAIFVMEEIGISLSGQSSKSVEAVDLDQMDLVVTLCGDAAEHCPTLPQHTARIHWGLNDPAKFTGSEQEVLEKFRETGELIRSRIQELIGNLRGKEHSRPSQIGTQPR